MFFNDRLLGPSPQLIRANPDASVNTVSAAAANHFDFHSVISEEDFKSRAKSITLEHKTTTVPESTPLADPDWQTHVLRWLRDRRRYSENPVLTRATVTYLSLIGEHDEAVAEAESALKLAPEWYMTHNAMGYALVGKGEVKRAIDCFRTTAAMKPDNYLGHYNLAAAFSLQKDYSQCIDNLERILDPTVLNTFSDAKQDIENDRDFNNIREDAEFQRRFADVCDKIKRAMNEDG